MSTQDFRPYVKPEAVPRLTPTSVRMSFTQYPPFLEGQIGVWAQLAKEPFRGITADGNVIPGLYALKPMTTPVEAATNAARAWLALFDAASRPRFQLPFDSPEWRHWHNTPTLLRDGQTQLSALGERQRSMAMELVRVSLSDQGYASVCEIMAGTKFLGEINQLQDVLNTWSYTMTVFGEPSATEPWGWQLFGHHLVLNCIFFAGQMTLTPLFLGIEPDSGHLHKRRLFEFPEQSALRFMRSLSEPETEAAVLFGSMATADQLPELYDPYDQRVRGGAFQDNRVIPYRGVPAASLSRAQRRNILELADFFLHSLPAGPKEARLEEIEANLSSTYFAWIGRINDVDPFYFRIQSPVVLAEFDHHSGIFLANKDPARFHVHTVLRSPNGNDYGADLLRQHYAKGGHDRHGAAHDNAHTHDGGQTFHRHD